MTTRDNRLHGELLGASNSSRPFYPLEINIIHELALAQFTFTNNQYRRYLRFRSKRLKHCKFLVYSNVEDDAHLASVHR